MAKKNASKKVQNVKEKLFTFIRLVRTISTEECCRVASFIYIFNVSNYSICGNGNQS